MSTLQRLVLAGLVVISFGGAYLAVSTTKALASAPRATGFGYFTNAGPQSTGFGQVILCGVLRASSSAATCANDNAAVTDLAFPQTDKTAFQNFILAKLASGGRDSIGAAFVIQTMRGNASHSLPNASDIIDWQTRLANPALTMRFQTNVSDDGWNTGYMRTDNDVAFFPQAGTNSALVFEMSGSVVYKLKANCANPTGQFPAGIPTTTAPTPPPSPPPPAPAPFIKSHFEVRGGDVVAGARFGDTPAICATLPLNPRAGIVGWNSGSPGYDGAGTEYAAYALSYIQDFVTHQNVPGAAPGPGGTQLSVTNDRIAINTAGTYGYFGGLFDGSPCVDYWGRKPAATQAFTGQSLADLPSGDNYYATGNVTLGPAVPDGEVGTLGIVTIPAGRHITLYVDGNVQVNQTIGYAQPPGGWASEIDIPTFRLIVNGNIYVHPHTNEMSGLYAAIPKAGILPITSTGVLSTCGMNFASIDTSDPPRFYSLCNHILNVYGSLAANQIHFLLRGGSYATGIPAETIYYGPEVWLGVSGKYSNEYQSVVGLPPIL